MLIERGRPDIDDGDIAVVAALQQPVGRGVTAFDHGRAELRRPDRQLLAPQPAAVRGPFLDAAVEDADFAVAEILQHPEQPRGMETAAIVIQDDVDVLVDAVAAEQRCQLFVGQPGPCHVRVGIIHAVGGNADRARNVAGLVVLLRPYVDDTNVVAEQELS